MNQHAYRPSRTRRNTWPLAIGTVLILLIVAAIDAQSWCIVAMLVTLSVWLLCVASVLALAKASRD